MTLYCIIRLELQKMIKFLFFKLLLLSFFFNSNRVLADVCEVPIIKDLKYVKNKIKTCRPGNRILIRYDIKIEKEILILNLCDLNYSVIQEENVDIIVKRNSGLKIVCIFKPSKKYSN